MNMKASRELTGKILEIFFLNHIICKVKECSSGSSVKSLANTVCKELGVICASSVKETIEEMLPQGFDKTIVSALLSEVSWYQGKKIGSTSIQQIAVDCDRDYHLNAEESISYGLVDCIFSGFEE